MTAMIPPGGVPGGVYRTAREGELPPAPGVSRKKDADCRWVAGAIERLFGRSFAKGLRLERRGSTIARS